MHPWRLILKYYFILIVFLIHLTQSFPAINPPAPPNGPEIAQATAAAKALTIPPFLIKNPSTAKAETAALISSTTTNVTVPLPPGVNAPAPAEPEKKTTIGSKNIPVSDGSQGKTTVVSTSTSTVSATVTVTKIADVRGEVGKDSAKGQKNKDPKIETKTGGNKEDTINKKPEILHNLDGGEPGLNDEKDDGMDGPPVQDELRNAQKAVDDNEKNQKMSDGNKLPKQNPLPSDEEPENSHFMAYFLTVTVLCGAAYILVHNRHKVMGLILEGRGGRRGRSGSTSGNRVKYNRVKTEDVEGEVNLTSKDAGRVIY